MTNETQAENENGVFITPQEDLSKDVWEILRSLK
jgi:hypothetical protein